jgi:signal transduction histidine kinase
MTSQFLTPQKLHHLLSIPPSPTASASPALDSPILGLLAATERELLAKLISEQQYAPGEMILKEGDAGDALYIIRSGRVAIVKGDFSSPTILAYRGAGEIIGEMALLENKPRSASVVALEESRLLRMSYENFQAWLRSNPILEMNLSKALSARLRAADEARSQNLLATKSLSRQFSELQTEKQQLLEIQRLRQETSDFIVHDLRNPLSLITGAVNILEMVLPEDILQANRELLELIYINSERMKRMIDSLLDVARMDAGETQLLLAGLDLPPLMKKVMDRMAPAVQSKNIKLCLPPAANLPAVVADEEKIDCVLANLIDNAIKFSPPEGQITLSAERQAQHILVSVINTGPLIPPEDRERIFERFTQASSPSLRIRSSGLGLAFCRLTVEAHGGRIWVEPEAGGAGNRFVFSLPLAAES